jgi:predicted nucleic acid-binding protein
MANINDYFGTYQIDSGKFYFDKDLFTSTSIPDKFILTDAESGEIVDEFKKNSLSLSFGTHKVYVSNIVKELGKNNHRFMVEKVMVYFSPKIRGNNYFGGIDRQTIQEVLFFLKEKQYLSFDNIDKIIAGCYVKDLDIKIDRKLPKHIKQTIQEYYKALKDRFNGNPDNYRHFQNKNKEGHGIVVNNRNSSTTKKPFFKFYDKGLELKTTRNQEFYSCLSQEIKDILNNNFIWRYEYQLKDKRHFDYYGISNRLVDIFEISQTKWAYIGKSMLNMVFQRQTRVVDTTKLKIVDRLQINFITFCVSKDLSDGAIQALYMKSARNKSEKYRLKKMFDKMMSVINYNDNDVKEAVAIVERINELDKIVGLV